MVLEKVEEPIEVEVDVNPQERQVEVGGNPT